MTSAVITPLGICDPHSFYNEARWQRCCVVCGKSRDFEAHHAVYKQALKRLGLRDNMLYDTFNALRLCELHHMRHHKGIRRVKTKELKDNNITYAFHVFGLYAADWLRQYYDDSEADPRIVQLES